MSGILELTHLLAKIAGEVHRPNADFDDHENAGTSMVIASLTKSLNSIDHSSSGTRVLDAALSLMCLKTTEVCSARIDRLIETMVSVLCSLVSCKISRLGNEGPELLQVGSSISFGDCGELMRVSADVLESLEANQWIFS
ncbi:uncharacterized protein LOC110026837 [Phalaenopsis equestris]|uniref:uncharacterized protein LOC110026837 n=1 Tax=Phalaenopsis equestris TaxID=78828 RepID=UPI0009E51213|nr:uncharacterized protein LOC110026837 [Phalaenopsis equestris]